MQQPWFRAIASARADCRQHRFDPYKSQEKSRQSAVQTAESGVSLNRYCKVEPMALGCRYIREHSEAELSHSICPKCAKFRWAPAAGRGGGCSDTLYKPNAPGCGYSAGQESVSWTKTSAVRNSSSIFRVRIDSCHHGRGRGHDRGQGGKRERSNHGFFGQSPFFRLCTLSRYRDPGILPGTEARHRRASDTTGRFMASGANPTDAYRFIRGTSRRISGKIRKSRQTVRRRVPGGPPGLGP